MWITFAVIGFAALGYLAYKVSLRNIKETLAELKEMSADKGVPDATIEAFFPFLSPWISAEAEKILIETGRRHLVPELNEIVAQQMSGGFNTYF